MADNTSSPPGSPNLLRRLASLLYESLIVFAIAIFSGGLLHTVTGGGLADIPRPILQIYLFAVLGAYFIWCWRHGGQTLPMKTWKLRLLSDEGARLTIDRAALRYLLAWPSIALAGAGIAWALLDRDGKFLHDRLAGTKIVTSGE